MSTRTLVPSTINVSQPLTIQTILSISALSGYPHIYQIYHPFAHSVCAQPLLTRSHHPPVDTTCLFTLWKAHGFTTANLKHAALTCTVTLGREQLSVVRSNLLIIAQHCKTTLSFFSKGLIHYINIKVLQYLQNASMQAIAEHVTEEVVQV